MNVAYDVKVIKMFDFGAVVYLEAPGNVTSRASELAWERTKMFLML
jgi:polyribonucleotide nucleotidyltransferase